MSAGQVSVGRAGVAPARVACDTAATASAGRDSRVGGPLVSSAEQHMLGLQLALALAAGGLLVLSAGLRLGAPDQADLAQLVAGGAALLVAGPAIAAAWHSLRHPDLHGVTDQLIALAMIAAWAAGDLTTAALLPLAMSIGHVLEERSLLGSAEAIRALARLTEAKARRRCGPDPLTSGATEEVPAASLAVGDLIELRAGDRVPADGVVRAGCSSLDTAAITGESVPREVAPGAAVYGSSINLEAPLLVEITRTGATTALGRVVSLMQRAERAKPPITRLLEQYAGRYMGLVLMLALGAWFATGSVTVLLAVLVASCPCALVLAAPATAVAAIAVAGRHGILVKGVGFLENLATVDAVVLDKTGTVTLGALRLVAARPEPGVDAQALTRLAGTLGAASNHPVARALAALVPSEGRLDLAEVREAQGLGVVARLGGDVVALGRPELFHQLGVAVSALPAHDGPIAGVARGHALLGWLLLADEPRPEARAAIAELKALGLARQVLLTGDRASVAARVAAHLGLSEVRAEALPETKLACVLEEVRRGFRPMVVGDGINDSLALRAGAVGVAMAAHGAADVAIASADIVLLSGDLRRLGTAIRLSRRCRTTIHANVAIGLGWTVLVVAAAASGALGASGALLAALLHNVGTFAVVGNAGRLLRFQEGDAGREA